MKKLICVLTLMLALMLALPVTARAEAAKSVSTQAPEADADENVWSIYDEDGQYLTSIYGRVYLDDEYISSDNRLYRIIEVDDSKRTAVAQYIGQESLLEPDNEAVATVAQESKRLIGIYSTHSDESYIPTDGAESKEKDAGIYDVDEALKNALEERGIEVELDTTTHLPHDAGAYRRSRSTAARLLKSQPAALLDIHRDGIPDPDEYVQKIEDEDATKVRLLVGKSNPNADANRKFAKQIKAAADEMYPDLIKDIYIGKGDYNQELAPRAILLEFGTHTIKKERAIKSTAYMADVLERVLFGSTAKAEGAADADADAAGAETTAEAGGSGAAWGILWVVGIALAAIVGYGLITTGSFSGMWNKVKRGASETTGGLLGKKRGEREK
ncbi:MAG: stage II sporulation protein P [Candidatus Fimadaptatus sp.]|nr:stage II sporulation protein P [Candidatus Fimadaptatus sp.]